MIRSFIPLDVVDLIVARRRLSNRVKTKDNIGKKDEILNNLAAILGGWFNPRFRSCVWVHTDGLTLRGLASVRDRCSPHVWEIDRLLVGEEDHNSCLKLLEHLSLIGGQLGIGKIFLRLPNDSLFLKDAEQMGFVPYLIEHLYWMERTNCSNAQSENIPALSPRPRRVDDDYQLFELYLRCIPAYVRRAEGMTFREWQSSRSRAVGQEWVLEKKDGGLVGWMAIYTGRGHGQIDLIAADKSEISSIVEYGLNSLLGSSSSQLFCLVPNFEGELQRLLEHRGFCRITTYCALIKELVVRESEPCVMPPVLA